MSIERVKNKAKRTPANVREQVELTIESREGTAISYQNEFSFFINRKVDCQEFMNRKVLFNYTPDTIDFTDAKGVLAQLLVERLYHASFILTPGLPGLLPRFFK